MKKGGEVTYVATATIDGKEYKASESYSRSEGNIHTENLHSNGLTITRHVGQHLNVQFCGKSEHTEDCTSNF